MEVHPVSYSKDGDIAVALDESLQARVVPLNLVHSWKAETHLLESL